MKTYQELVGKRVRAYRNLHKGCLSIQEKTPKGWRVAAHLETLVLDDARFIVKESGRQRVIREKRKNVHAYVEGVLSDRPINEEGLPVFYNPYRFDAFMLEGTAPIHLAELVSLGEGGRIMVHARDC